jgi:hypothetical protein
VALSWKEGIVAKKQTINVRKVGAYLAGEGGKPPQEILGFATVVLGENGGVVVGVTASIPSKLGVRELESPPAKVLLACQLLSKVLQGVVVRRKIIDEVEQQRALDAVRGKLPPTRVMYVLTPEGLVLLPSEGEVEMLGSPKGEA